MRKAPQARRQAGRAVLQHTTAARSDAATTATSASANIGGADYVIGGARLSEAITNPEGQVEARLPRDQVYGPSAGGDGLREHRRGLRRRGRRGGPAGPGLFRPERGYDALADSIQAVTQNKEAYPKSVRKAGGAFLAATAATLESYNTGDFEKALVQSPVRRWPNWILAGYCARVGVVAGAPVAKPAKGPVTRRTYLPGPFQPARTRRLGPRLRLGSAAWGRPDRVGSRVDGVEAPSTPCARALARGRRPTAGRESIARRSPGQSAQRPPRRVDCRQRGARGFLRAMNGKRSDTLVGKSRALGWTGGCSPQLNAARAARGGRMAPVAGPRGPSTLTLRATMPKHTQ